MSEPPESSEPRILFQVTVVAAPEVLKRLSEAPAGAEILDKVSAMADAVLNIEKHLSSFSGR